MSRTRLYTVFQHYTSFQILWCKNDLKVKQQVSNKNKQKTKEIEHEILKTFHNLNFNKIKYPKFIDNSKEIKSSDEISFGAVRQEIFQNGEDVINEFDVKTYFITHNLKG